MPTWYFDKKQLKVTPSFSEGIKSEAEKKYRSDGSRLILNLGVKMGLRYDSIATGALYFHRFYMCHSFKKFPRYHLTGCACLFLAGKVEETPKKAKDLMKSAKATLFELKGSDDVFAAFGDDPKEEMLVMECVILQTIKFDLQVEHPYKYLVKYAKVFKAPRQKVEQVVQMAWTFVNDSLSGTTLCLQWEPEVVAVAVLSLAGKMNQLDSRDWHGKQPGQHRWWERFIEGIAQKHLDDIGHQILDMYDSNSKGGGGGDGLSQAPSSSSGAASSKSTPTTSPKGGGKGEGASLESDRPTELLPASTAPQSNPSPSSALAPKREATSVEPPAAPLPPPPPPPSFPPPPPNPSNVLHQAPPIPLHQPPSNA
ncbi:unnamed protein product, partial [Cyprideis torosa]